MKKMPSKAKIEKWLNKQIKAQKVCSEFLDEELYLCNCHRVDNPNRVHMLGESVRLLAHILEEDMKVEMREDTSNPYAISFEHNGILVWGIETEEEYKERGEIT